MEHFGWLVAGLLGGGICAFLVMKRTLLGVSYGAGHDPDSVPSLLARNFHPLPTSDITITERRFPFRVRANLQRAIEQLFGAETEILHFLGVRKEYSHEQLTLSDCIIESQHNSAISIPPEYEELDIGADDPIRVLKNGLWLLEKDGVRFAVLLTPARSPSHEPLGLRERPAEEVICAWLFFGISSVVGMNVFIGHNQTTTA